MGKSRVLLTLTLVLGVSTAVMSSGATAAPKLTSATEASLINEDFSTAGSLQDFTVVCGGAWTSSDYVLTLPDPVSHSACTATADLLVANRTLSGAWGLTLRAATLPTLPGDDGFSVVFGYEDPTDYFYASFDQSRGADKSGVYRVRGPSPTLLAPFTSAMSGIIPGRYYDISLLSAGDSVTVQEDGSTLAILTDPSLGVSTRIGIASQGSRVAVRRLDVVTEPSLVAPTPTPSDLPDPTPALSRATDPTPTATATPAPSSTPTPAPSSTRTPAPTSTPTRTPSPTPEPSATPRPTPAPTPPSSTPPAGSAACSPGSFPVSSFAPDFVGPATRTFTEQFITDQGSDVQVCYPAGSTSPSSGDPGGAQAELAIAHGPALSYTLSYQISFPVGFEWVKGGKLPGLCGGECWTGSDNGPGGWAARFMWRADGAAEVLLSDATTTGDGTDLGRGTWTWLADGAFHPLTEQVTMNTPGVANGSIVVTYNGVQVGDFTGLTLAATGDTEEVDSLMFSTFFGGHDSSWAPSTTQHIDFADFSVR
jgi:hypothetical protein